MAEDPRIPGITLRNEEEVIFISKWHWVVFLRLRNILLLPLLWQFLRWKNNVDVLTNQRVIEQEGVISTSQKTIELSKIQNISCVIRGLLPRLMNIGLVHIETAGQRRGSDIYFSAVPKPQQLADQIQEAMVAAKKREMLDMARTLKGEA